MNPSVGSKLIIVEGLTGSGKSIMAHFIARQLEYNGIAASWLHEGEISHPILIDVDTTIDSYAARIRVNWAAFVDQVGLSGKAHVIEASFFNNLLETLLAHNVERTQIVQFAADLQALSEPLNPTLVYLVQEDVEQALVQSFGRRGTDFRSFVIDLATSTPLAKDRGWEGYAGMLLYWQEFVALTDELFERFPYRKLKIDNTAGDWEAYNRQVLDHLSISPIPEQTISPTEASRLVGVYRDGHSGREFAVRFEAGELGINLFLEVWTRLVRRAHNEFAAEGWPFEISFEADDRGKACVMKIGGRNVDYLPLVGTVAERASA
jgi:hypothetical protein